jgi:uncharacterized Zn-finger protein
MYSNPYPYPYSYQQPYYHEEDRSEPSTEETVLEPVMEPVMFTHHTETKSVPKQETKKTKVIEEDERDWYVIKKQQQKRIYICSKCSKEFTRAFNLKDHYKSTHLNLKPYKCKVGDCNSRFARKNDCIRHIKLIHHK